MISLRRLLRPLNPAKARCAAVGHVWTNRDSYVKCVFDPMWWYILYWGVERCCARCRANATIEYEMVAPDSWEVLDATLRDIQGLLGVDREYVLEHIDSSYLKGLDT